MESSMLIGPSLVFLTVALQSLGKVLYGTFLGDVSVPLFVLLSFCLTVAVSLAFARFRLPRQGRAPLAALNLSTAVSFIGFFFALKHLPPAIVAAIEIGASLLAAMAVVAVQDRAWPGAARALACAAIVAGCALLAWAEITASLSEPDPALVWTAVAACALSGLTSTVSATASKRLAAQGWRPACVLGHRFYLTIAIAVAWLPAEASGHGLPDGGTLALIVLVGAVGTLVPLLMFQLALRCIDELALMVCLAAQPVLSFLLSLPSPAYDWSVVTLVGIAAVTAGVGADIAAQRRAAPGLAA